MKKILMFVAVAFLATGSFAQTSQSAQANSSTVIMGPDTRFESVTHDFGKITEGTQAKYSFKFKNAGNSDLVISNVSTPCGCTTPTYSKEPIAPGKTGEIVINYNSTGKSGPFNKVCTVTTNQKDNVGTTITISGEVIPKPSDKSNAGK